MGVKKPERRSNRDSTTTRTGYQRGDFKRLDASGFRLPSWVTLLAGWQPGASLRGITLPKR